MTGYTKHVNLRKLIRFAEDQCGGPIVGCREDVFNFLKGEMTDRLHDSLLAKGHFKVIDVPEDQIIDYCTQFPTRESLK